MYVCICMEVWNHPVIWSAKTGGFLTDCNIFSRVQEREARKKNGLRQNEEGVEDDSCSHEIDSFLSVDKASLKVKKRPTETSTI